MKTLGSFFSTMIMAFNSFGQEPNEAELLLSVDSIQKTPVKVRNCYATADKREPLFVNDGAPFLPQDHPNVFEMFSPDEIVSISVLESMQACSLYGTAGNNGVIVINTNRYSRPVLSRKKYPFKVYTFLNGNWITSQDMFNEIRAIVPGQKRSNHFNFSFPKIKMRGDDNTIVIVDGVRVDASILNTLNLADIESVSVAPSVAATNYFINN